MTRRDDRVLFGHMLDAAERARRSVAGVDKSSFEANETLQLALTRLIQIIGEAARDVSPQGRSSLPQTPWAQIVGMRHRLVHDYDNVDLNILWDVVQQSLPPLITALGEVVPNDPTDLLDDHGKPHGNDGDR
jgi:uncharacterized protein with HEPN domain